MKSISVAVLKSNLSGYLQAVKKGEEIIVTSHRHPIARLMPVGKATADLGIIPANKPISSLKKIKGISLNFDPLEFLLADRRRR